MPDVQKHAGTAYPDPPQPILVSTVIQYFNTPGKNQQQVSRTIALFPTAFVNPNILQPPASPIHNDASARNHSHSLTLWAPSSSNSSP
eukprot:scaffold35028_cov17-Tisochrysis_lutea.AAC.2